MHAVTNMGLEEVKKEEMSEGRSSKVWTLLSNPKQKEISGTYPLASGGQAKRLCIMLEYHGLSLCRPIGTSNDTIGLM